jgi:hypothetical protein
VRVVDGKKIELTGEERRERKEDNWEETTKRHLAGVL